MTDRQYGHFEQDGREFVITERKTPRHWYNYFYNDTYNAFTSQVGVGEGLAQDDLGNRIVLITNRMMYIVDHGEKQWCSANGLPLSRPVTNFRCRHGLGYTVTESEWNGLRMTYTVFVPLCGNREQWTVTVENTRAAAADLRAIAFASTVTDGVYRAQAYNTDVGGFDAASQGAMTRIFTEYGAKEPVTKYGYLVSDGEVTGFDTRRNAFIGVYGHEDAPEALETHGGCTNSDCVGEKLCFALETALPLAPGACRTIHFEIGIADEIAGAAAARARLMQTPPERELEALKAERLREISGAQIQTVMAATITPTYEHARGRAAACGAVRRGHAAYRRVQRSAHRSAVERRQAAHDHAHACGRQPRLHGGRR